MEVTARKRRGGPQPGSGHPKGPASLARSKRLTALLRPSELADLQSIAEAWGVAPGTALWGIVHERLTEWRAKAADFGPSGLAIVAGLDVLGYGPAVMRKARELVEGARA